MTGINDNTLIVDANLFEDVKLLQTGLSSLSENFFIWLRNSPLHMLI